MRFRFSFKARSGICHNRQFYHYGVKERSAEAWYLRSCIFTDSMAGGPSFAFSVKGGDFRLPTRLAFDFLYPAHFLCGTNKSPSVIPHFCTI
jgi:hypothetical protein